MNWLHFVSLIYRKQPLLRRRRRNSCCELTTFRIFDISQTAIRCLRRRCEQLWIDYISYLWYIANSCRMPLIGWNLVVNWLHFVSLIYRKQPVGFANVKFTGCELTTFRIFDISQTAAIKYAINIKALWIDYISYLWYIANSQTMQEMNIKRVVNWLHFVSLIYRKQHDTHIRLCDSNLQWFLELKMFATF